MALAVASAPVQAQTADVPALPEPLPATGPTAPPAACPVTGTLRLTNAAMLDRFRSLSACRVQATPVTAPAPAAQPAPVALEGRGEGEAPAAESESGGAVEVRGSDPAAAASAILEQPLAAAGALPDTIVRLRPIVAELDLAGTAAATALPTASILDFAPRSYTTRHDRLIAATARRHGIDPLLLHAMVRQESNYGADVRSPAGAIGLMQIMPATGARFGHRAALLVDPASNLDAGARLLRALHARYGNDLDLILAAYNAGEGAVARHGNRVPPFRETRNYVRLVKGHYAALAAQNGQLLATRF